jgi:putative sigma-54 modulation protein
MIKLAVSGRGYEIDEGLREYVDEKIGGLERYLPRQMRSLAAGTVVLTDDPSGREDNRFVCEAIITVGRDKFVAKEGTINMYASVDVVDAKLASQLRAFKERHVGKPRRTRMLGRLIGRVAEDMPAAGE